MPEKKTERKTYPCKKCGKIYYSPSGVWKHNKKCQRPDTIEPKPLEPEVPEVKEEIPVSEKEMNEPVEQVSEETPEWLHYEPTVIDENSTEQIPAALKFASKAPTGSFSRETNKALLMMGYGATDHMLSWYADAVTMGEISVIAHTQEDKLWTADLTVDWLEEAGIDISSKLTKGHLALAANAFFVGAPMVKIQRESKVEVAKELSQRFAKWPLIGGWLQRRVDRKNKKKISDFGNKFSVQPEAKVESGVYVDE